MKKTKQLKMKEIRFRPATAENDLKTKLKQVKKFLEKGHQVKISVLFKRCEKKTMMPIAKEKLEKFQKLGKSSSPVKIKGNTMTTVLM